MAFSAPLGVFLRRSVWVECSPHLAPGFSPPAAQVAAPQDVASYFVQCGLRSGFSTRTGRPGVVTGGSAWASVSLRAWGVMSWGGRGSSSYLVARTTGVGQGHKGMAQATHTSPPVFAHLVNTLSAQHWLRRAGGVRLHVDCPPAKPWQRGGGSGQVEAEGQTGPGWPESQRLAAAVFKRGPGIWTSTRISGRFVCLEALPLASPGEGTFLLAGDQVEPGICSMSSGTPVDLCNPKPTGSAAAAAVVGVLVECCAEAAVCFCRAPFVCTPFEHD